MRVAALSPQFVIEPPSETGGAAERVDAGVEERMTSVASSAGDQGLDRSIDEQTREAIRRLSQFVRKQKEDADSKKNTKNSQTTEGDDDLETEEGNAKAADAQRKIIFVYLTHEQRALLTYRYAMTAGADDDIRGGRLAVVA